MNSQELAALADTIVAQRASKKPMDIIAATANLSEADAYKVQFLVHDKIEAAGDTFAGWKVALTLPTQYEPLKLSGPVFAGLFKSGLRQSGAVFEPGYPIKPGIEPELVARMGKDAGPGTTYTADTIKDHVANLYCGMELVDNRYADVTKMSGPARIADDVLQAACVIGTEIKDWKKLDFANLKGRSLLDGKEIANGSGSAVMGSAMISLAWLANKLVSHGKHLRAGDVILTGSVHPPAFLGGKGVARTEFEGLGGTEITIK
ncbi:MAG: fumarylacetoacetate hydrolase family protein [Proteobacteria bacterium]|nr:fumarylacetoacetate hydrolase family protein [Pseudomonadota bacterium]